MTAAKRFCLMFGGAQIVVADDNYWAGRFGWSMVNMAIVMACLWASRSEKDKG